MVRARHVVNLAQDERIVKRYHVARKPAFPEINRYLTVTNQRVIMETRVESALYGMELYDEAHLDVIRGTTVGYEKGYNPWMLVAGVFFILYGILGVFFPLMSNVSIVPLPICITTSLILLLLGMILLLYSGHESFYLKLKMQHIGDIDFGVLKKGLGLLSIKPGPDADEAIIELGALIKTLQKNPDFSFAHPPPSQPYQRYYEDDQYARNDRLQY